MIIALALIGWFACGFLAWGLDFARSQKCYPSIARSCYKSDLLVAIVLFLFGLVALISEIFYFISFPKNYMGFKWL